MNDLKKLLKSMVKTAEESGEKIINCQVKLRDCSDVPDFLKNLNSYENLSKEVHLIVKDSSYLMVPCFGAYQ